MVYISLQFGKLNKDLIILAMEGKFAQKFLGCIASITYKTTV